MGFDGMLFGRDDYQDYNQRNSTKTKEMIWKASANLGKECIIINKLNENSLNITNMIRSSKLVIYWYFTRWLRSTKIFLF